jgi:serine/threonine protein kinase
MNSRAASVRAAGGLDRVDRAVQLLEDEWRRHGEVQLDSFWMEQVRTKAVAPDESLGVLAALIKADLRQRYDLGQTPAVTGYLERFPELRTAHSQVLSLVYEEYCLSEERGSAPEVESFCERYPEWKSSLASQLRCHRLFGQAAGQSPVLPRFPEPGETFEEFQLLSLLGEGGTSRVFLAKNLSLGGKQVALKVTLDRGQEPDLQGALDHPHIVPVHSVTYQLKGALCGLSMPYQPGLPLDKVIKAVKPAERPRKAIALWDVLLAASPQAAQAADPSGEQTPRAKAGQRRFGPRGDGWEGFPARGTYAQGVAWFGMIVARALQHAHSKKTYHRDVKPANILLTIANGPQLLDFNLAESPHSAARVRAALHGGTLPYMAPEQIEAFLNPELWNQVEARADVYSLGLVLRELLTGQAPDLPQKALAPARAMRDLLDRRLALDLNVRRVNPAIPHALQAIVAKCLMHSPDDRYPDAESLAEDLDRFLRHQPLLKTANPSRQERAANWAIRHRRAFTGAAAVLGVLAVGLGVWRSGVLSSRPVSTRPALSLEASLGLESAIRQIDGGEAQQAIRGLGELEKRDPEKEDPYLCLVKLYLGFALSQDEKTEFDAEKAMQEALSYPHAHDMVREWVTHDPSVANRLVDFANAAINLADETAQKYDTDKVSEKDVRDNSLRKRAYDVARDVLRLAEELGPASRKLELLLAATEGFFEQFVEAHERLSRFIASSSLDDKQERELWFISRQRRGRLTCLSVEQDRKGKTPSSQKTLDRLDEARHDLDDCVRYLSLSTYTDQRVRGRKEFYVQQDRLRVILTQAEVALELSRRAGANEQLKRQAERHLNSADGIISELRDLSRTLDLPEPKQLTQRWIEARGGPAQPATSPAARPTTVSQTDRG